MPFCILKRGLDLLLGFWFGSATVHNGKMWGLNTSVRSAAQIKSIQICGESSSSLLWFSCSMAEAESKLVPEMVPSVDTVLGSRWGEQAWPLRAASPARTERWMEDVGKRPFLTRWTKHINFFPVLASLSWRWGGSGWPLLSMGMCYNQVSFGIGLTVQGTEVLECVRVWGCFLFWF